MGPSDPVVDTDILKIVVERAVRPVRASVSCKRKMREELLARGIGVFEEEFSRLDDEHTALERAALRFGNPSEVTSQLQESVPAGDGITRFFEGRPGESMNRGVLRLVSGLGVVCLVVFRAVLFAAGWDRVWSLEELKAVAHEYAEHRHGGSHVEALRHAPSTELSIMHRADRRGHALPPQIGSTHFK